MSGREAGEGSLPPEWRGRPPGEWAEELGVPALELHARIGSTNRRLRTLAAGGAAVPWTTVVAGEQTAGRGRAGRSWHSPPGAGLWMSVLLETVGASGSGVLPLAAGVSVARALEEMSGAPMGLKWPNDILFGERKIAGILCEAHGQDACRAIVGIGVNVRRPQEGYPPGLEARAAFLGEASAGRIGLPRLAGSIIRELRRWADPPPPRLSGAVRGEWEARDVLPGRPVRLAGGTSGTARGVSGEGWLRVTSADGTMATVRAGAVEVAGWGSPRVTPARGAPAPALPALEEEAR